MDIKLLSTIKGIDGILDILLEGEFSIYGVSNMVFEEVPVGMEPGVYDVMYSSLDIWHLFLP